MLRGPFAFVDECFGNEIRFTFRIGKVLDFAGRADELLAGGNVAGILVAIKLVDLQVHDPSERFRAKIRLLRRLVERVDDRALRSQLTRFLIQGIMIPPPIADEFHAEVRRVEQEYHMPFVTVYEQQAADLATLKAKRDDVLRFARARFKTLPDSLADRISAIESVDALDMLVDLAATAETIDDFAKGVAWSSSRPSHHDSASRRAARSMRCAGAVLRERESIAASEETEREARARGKPTQQLTGKSW